VCGTDLDWPADDDAAFDGGHKQILSSICREHEVPFDLIAKMLEAERRTTGMARRAGVQKELEKVLAEEWRSEEDILAKREPSLELE
jgi:DNA sulfur modification protein DndC